MFFQSDFSEYSQPRHMGRLYVISLLVLVLGVELTWAQTVKEIDTYRPLRAAIESLESQIGFPINYEDPVLDFAPDLEDLSRSEQNINGSGSQRLVPRRGRYIYTLPVDFQSVEAPVLRLTLSGMVAEYNSQGLPGRFRVLDENGIFIVTADSAKNRQGSFAPFRSPMSHTITGAVEGASLFEALSKCAELISNATGKRIHLGKVVFSPFPKVGFKVTGGTARDLFGQINTQLPGFAISYELLHEPFFGYMLNTRLVRLRNEGSTTSTNPVAVPVDKEPASRFFVKTPPGNR